MSIDDPMNYSKSMLKHFDGMSKTNLENYYEVERILNAHMRSWFIMMKGNQRLARNFRASNNTMPPLYGLRKDHKEFESLIEGPPTRPVCGGIVSCNYRISYFLSQFLKPLIKDAPARCDSTDIILFYVMKTILQPQLNFNWLAIAYFRLRVLVRSWLLFYITC